MNPKICIYIISFIQHDLNTPRAFLSLGMKGHPMSEQSNCIEQLGSEIRFDIF